MMYFMWIKFEKNDEVFFRMILDNEIKPCNISSSVIGW